MASPVLTCLCFPLTTCIYFTTSTITATTTGLEAVTMFYDENTYLSDLSVLRMRRPICFCVFENVRKVYIVPDTHARERGQMFFGPTHGAFLEDSIGRIEIYPLTGRSLPRSATG